MDEMIEEGEVQDAESRFEKWFDSLVKEGSMREICETIAEMEEEIRQIKQKIREIKASEESWLKYGSFIPDYEKEIAEINQRIKLLKKRKKELQEQRRALGNLNARVDELRSKGLGLWKIIENDLVILSEHVEAYLKIQNEYHRLEHAYRFLSEDDSEPFPPALELGRDVRGYIKERISKI